MTMTVYGENATRTRILTKYIVLTDIAPKQVAGEVDKEVTSVE